MRAATVALAGVAAGDAEEGEGKGERGQRGGGRLQQEQQGAPPAPPPPPLTHGSCSVRFHLPGRKLVRPTLIILASGEEREHVECKRRCGEWLGVHCDVCLSSKGA